MAAGGSALKSGTPFRKARNQASATSGESSTAQDSASLMPKKKCRNTAAIANSMASMGARLRRGVSVMRAGSGSGVE
jgi:hypothetical protein